MASILVVDDDTAGRQFLVTLLGYTGYRVFEAENGAQALEIAHAEHPDLIITDMLMPVMGGYELARQLREERDFDDIAVIFYTATFRESEINSLAKAAGVHYGLSKPAEPQAILDLVNTALGQTSASGSRSQIITKQVPNPLQVVSEKLSAKMGELEGVNLRLSELIALGMEISAERNPQRLLEKFCERARKILNAEYAAVRILAKDGQSTRYFITSGLDPETVARLGSPPTGEGVPSALLNEHQAIRLRDLTTDPRSAGFPPGHPIMRSFLGVPIATSVQKYGNFYLTEKIGEQEFSEEDERLAVTLALQVAVAYENARLYDDIQSHAAMLQIEISRREQAEDSLMTSEELFRTSFQYSAAGMCITTLDGRLKTVNQALADMLGFTKAELEGKHFNDITHPEDLEIGKDAVGRMISGAVPNVSFEKRYLRKTGEAVWTYVSSSLLRDSSGKPLHFITQIMDNTERKRAQDKSERQNQRLKILREIDIAILAADSVEDIVGAALSHIRELIDCRRAILTLIDWGTNEVLIFAISAVDKTPLPPGSRVPLAQFKDVIPTLSQNQPMVFSDLRVLADPTLAIQLLLKDGILSTCSLPLFSQGNLIGMFSMHSEIPGFFDEEKINLGREVANQVTIAITQSRLIEGLRESEQKFSTLFTKAPFAVQLTKLPAGDIVEANEEFEKLVGYSREELIGKTSLDLNMYPDPETRARMVAEFQARGVIRNAELAFRTKYGDLRHLLTSSDLIDIGGEKHVLTTAQDITERKRAEEQLRYQAYLLENVNDAIIASDAQFRLKAWNLAAEEMYGWKAEEVLGRNGVEILQTRFSEADAEEMRRQIAESGFYLGEATQLRKDGTRIPVEVASIVLRDDGGNITDYVSVNRDITERKQAEADLRVENERFQRFVESNIVGIVIADASGKIITANDYYLNILGVTRQDFEDGKVDWREFTPPEWLAADEKAIQELRERGVCEPYEKEYVLADGTRVPVYIADAMLPGPEEQIAAFVLDITELKRAEQRLRESEQKYSALFEKSAVPAALLRLPEVVIVDVNEAFEKLTGFTKQEITGKTAVELGLGKKKERARMIAQFEEQGSLNDDETPLITKSGEERIIVANTNPLLLNGEPYALTTARDITEHKRAEEELRISEERFSKAFFASPAGLTITRIADGKFVDVNDAFLRMYEFSRAEVIGHTSTELNILSPEERAKLIQAQLESGGLRNAELQARAKSGRIVNILFSSSPMELGGETCHVTTMIDITERKQAQEVLALREKRFRALIEHIADVIALVSPEGMIAYTSPGITNVLGYTVDEYVGQNAFELVHPDDLESAGQILSEILRRHGSSVPFIARERHKNGSWRWLEAVVTNLLEEPAVQALVVNFRDMTERKRAEENIERQLQRLKALRIIDMAISTSFDMTLSLTVLLNQTMMQLGVSAADILLHNPSTLTLEYAVGKGFTSSAIEQTHLRLGEGLAGRAALERRKTQVVNLAQHADQNARQDWLKEEGFVSYYATPLIAKGELKGVLEVFDRAELQPNQEWLDFVETLAGQAAIAIDNSNLFINLQRTNADLELRVAERTTELNRANRDLERANRAKDEFLANMSHELRTPLNSILGLSESLLEQGRGPLNDYQQKYVQTIETSGRHLLDLINDILDLSKIEAGLLDYYPQNVGVDDICRSSLAFVKNQSLKKSIDLSYENQSSIAMISADPRRLKQILVNLLNNAVKFTPDNGRVTLEVRSDPEKDLMQFSIIDTGIGILPEDLQRLFTPFVQVDSNLDRRYEGTGLGLALVQKLTDLHGGSVQVESEVGMGSRFTINLYCKHNISEQTEDFRPQQTPEFATGMERTEFQADAPATPHKILLAEDNAANILAIGEYLESYGYEIVIAHDGLEAIEKAMEVDPDIILMDIQMPALDGLEATRRLRANPRFTSTPIIALTALTMPGDRERCLEAGVNDYISKPVSLKALRQRIASLLD